MRKRREDTDGAGGGETSEPLAHDQQQSEQQVNGLDKSKTVPDDLQHRPAAPAELIELPARMLALAWADLAGLLNSPNGSHHPPPGTEIIEAAWRWRGGEWQVPAPALRKRPRR
jgi:hypothetical protein